MADPIVSILTPFLNPGRFLAEAIASVREQDFGGWELLLIDDGSSDESIAVARAAAAEDERIRLIAASPSGPQGAAAARNRGLAEARGEIVAFLDADDRYEPAMLQRHVALMASHPDAAMVYGPTRWWHPADPAQDRLQDMSDLAGRLHPAPALLESVILLNDSPVPCTCAITVRRRVLQAAGGFDEGFRLYEDQTAWARIMLDYPVLVDDRPAALYRQHGDSVSAAAIASGEYRANAGHPAREAFLDWVEELVAGHEMERRLSRRIARARWRMRQQDRRWYRAWRRMRRVLRRMTRGQGATCAAGA